MKKLLCLVLIFITLFCIGCNSVYGNESASEDELSNDEDSLPEGSRSFTVAYPAPVSDGTALPDKIPQSMLNELEKMCNKKIFGNAFYYCDLKTGLVISYNADRYFAAASLQKATYLYFIFDMLDRGKIALTDEHILLSRHKSNGSGSLYKKDNGTVLTLKEIIELMISISDNTAYKMLWDSDDDRYPSLSGYHSLINKQFGMRGMNTKGTLMTLNAEGTGKVFAEIYNRSLTSKNFEWYVKIMKSANQNKYIKGGVQDGGGDYEVSHKYGMDYRVCDDAGIVHYKDRPYVLVLLADYLGDENNPTSFMRDVSEKIFYIHEYITDPSKWKN